MTESEFNSSRENHKCPRCGVEFTCYSAKNRCPYPYSIPCSMCLTEAEIDKFDEFKKPSDNCAEGL